MNIIRLFLFIFISTVFEHSWAERYVHINGGIDYVKHSTSIKNYTLMNLSAGLGYSFKSRIGFEIGVSAKSKSRYVSEPNCNSLTRRTCTTNESISRFMINSSIVYNFLVLGQSFYTTYGLSVIDSSYISSRKGLTRTKELVNESNRNYSGIFSLGMVITKNHRIGVNLSSTYGSTKIGKFKYFGFAYGYLIPF